MSLFISYTGYCKIGYDSPTIFLESNQLKGGSTPVYEAMAKKTLREFSAPSTENIRTGPTLKTDNLEFELKPSPINMVQLPHLAERHMKMLVLIFRIS